jgi:hypothetical protein
VTFISARRRVFIDILEFFFLFSVALWMTGAAGHQGTKLLSGLRGR